MGWALAASAQTTITVDTNRDVADPGDGRTSLREAILQANAVPPGPDVVITFSAAQFPPNPGSTWTHNPNAFYYDQPDAQGDNDPNRIIVGAKELQGLPGYPADAPPAPAVPLPLPPITRSGVRLDADIDDNGVPDVRLDLYDLFYIHHASQNDARRSYGLAVGDPADNLGGPSDVIIEGLDVRFGQRNAADLTSSVPGVWLREGTDHRVRTMRLVDNGIGVETSAQLGARLFIGGISPGSNNVFTNNSYAGVFLRDGSGAVTIQNSDFNGNGTPYNDPAIVYDQFSGAIVVGTQNTGANIIGGTVGGARNDILNSNTHGIVLRGSGDNVVQNNLVEGNQQAGIRVSGVGNNIIGGSASAAGSVIRANGQQTTVVATKPVHHHGIYIDPDGNGDNVIQGNTIGGPDAADGNGGAGIFIEGDGDNRIGGTAADARNLISQNGVTNISASKSGVDIRGDGDNIIEGNRIGTTANGLAAAGNVAHGINIFGSGDNTIGGTTAEARNILSGNKLNGVRLQSSGNVVVIGNYVGVGADGTTAVPNQVSGFDVTNSGNGLVRIGGVSTGERNIVSANGTDGITINGSGPVEVFGNYVGVDVNGQADLGNSRHGVSISSNAVGQVTIGGRAPGQGNVISGNGQFGVTIEGTPAGATNILRGNRIGVSADAGVAIANNAGGVSVNAAVRQIIGGSALGDGNIIAGNRGGAGADGIELIGSGDHLVLGNLIGAVPADPANYPQNPALNPAPDFGNDGAGILIGTESTGAIEIGRPAANERNIIVNHGLQGVQIAGTGNVTLVNNLIGVGPGAAGLQAMPNRGDGVLISGSGNNIIGRNEESPDNVNTTFYNVISANLGNGVNITGTGDNQLTHNLIGTDETGQVDLGNGDGTGNDGTDNGIAITGTGTNTVRNNTISGNANHGLYIFVAGPNSLHKTVNVRGNSIGINGLDRNGDAALANGGYGILVADRASGVLNVGGPNAADANIISGNVRSGLRIEGNVDNNILGNFIGTDGSGNQAVPNGTAGGNDAGVILVGTDATVTDLIGNVVSGNNGYGVFIVSGTNSLRRNLIGTNGAGTAALGNTSHGIYINDPNLPTERQGVRIGERALPGVDEGNVISANGGDGIRIAQGGGNLLNDAADDILIHNNRIGLDINGSADLGNAGAGIWVERSVEGKIQIGGVEDGQGNAISGNGDWGVRFEGAFTFNPANNIDNTPLIYGNVIGLTEQGTAARPNDAGGVLIDVPATGGTGASQRVVYVGTDATGLARPTGAARFSNLISGNSGDGLRFAGSAGAVVAGNYIGTDFFAQNVRPNTGDGIAIGTNVTGPVRIGAPVGSTTPEDFRNLIAANGGYGVRSDAAGVVTIVGNYFGARESGGAAAVFGSAANPAGGNDAGGILLAGGGGAAAGAESVIVDNAIYSSGVGGTGPAAGIHLTQAHVARVQSNELRGNTGDGVRIEADDQLIGSTATDATSTAGGNTIVGPGSGITVVSGTGNRLSGNLITSPDGSMDPASPPIDLGGDGVTLNSETAANNANESLDYPVLDLLTRNPSTGNFVISGTVPSDTQAVELYQAPAVTGPISSDPEAYHGPAMEFLVRVTTFTNDPGSGGRRFTVEVPTGGGPGRIDETEAPVLVTALAIDSSGNTSELSRNTGELDVNQSTVEVDQTTLAADGSETVTVTVTLRDALGTVLPGKPNVAIAVELPDGTTVPGWVAVTPPSGTAQTTDANGQIQATLRATDRPACEDQTLTIEGLVDGAELPDSATVTVVAGEPAAAESSLTTTTPNVVADGTATAELRVTLRDASASACPVPGVDPSRVEVVVDSGDETGLSPAPPLTATGPSNANGEMIFRVASSVADTLVFSATLDGQPITGDPRQATVVFEPGPVDIQASTFTADPTQVIANGSSTTTLTLRIVDAQGNPVAGIAASDIVITPTPGDGVDVVKQTGPTNANGEFTATATATQPGTVSFAARVLGTTLEDRPTVEFTTDAPSDQSSLVAFPTTARPNGLDQVALTATVRDAFGNPVEGVEVTILPIGGPGVAVIQPADPTDENGQATAVASSTQAGTVTFQASTQVNGQKVVIAQAVVTFVEPDPDAALSSLAITGMADPLLANGQREVTVTVTLVDEDGQPLAGVAPQTITPLVTLAGTNTPAPGVAVNGPVNATDSNGRTTFTLTRTQPGAVDIRVRVGDEADGVVLDDVVTARFMPYLTRTLGPGLHFIGLPGRPGTAGMNAQERLEAADPRAVFRDLIPGLELARWDAAEQRYRVWDEFSPREPFQVLPGRGFWIQIDQPTSITSVAEPTPTDQPVTLDAAQGWNAFANPYPRAYDFELERIEVLQNGSVVGPLSSAAAQQLVEPYVWRWDPVLEYLLVLDPDLAAPAEVNGRIPLGEGFWWLVRGNNVQIRLLPPTANRGHRARAAATPGSWMASLEATTAQGTGAAYFGAGTTRMRAEAPPQAVEPPAVTVRLVDAQGRAASDVRTGPLTERTTWDVEVASREPGDVTLSWRGLNRSLPAGQRLVLIDPVSGRRTVMNSRASYRYTQQAPGVRRMQVELDPHGRRSLDIIDFKPGVSRGRGRGLTSTLTLTAEARVVVTVKGVGGRVVRQFETTAQDGPNAVSWDGRDNQGRPVPAGTYVIEVVAQSDEGEVARAVRTIVVR